MPSTLGRKGEASVEHIKPMSAPGLRLLAALGVMACCLVGGRAMAQMPPAPADPASEGQQVAQQLQAWFALAFELPPALAVDSELRTAVNAMVQAQQPRIAGLLSDWFAQEQARDPATARPTLQFRVATRLINEFALWQLDSAGAQYDATMQRARAHPRVCEWPAESLSPFAQRVLVWQHVPAAQRSALLAAEAGLLQRLGEPRPMAPARPVPSADEWAWDQVEALIKRKVLPPVPMPPLLAWRTLNDMAETALQSKESTRCVLRQWSLAMAERDSSGALSEADSLALRYADVTDANRWIHHVPAGTVQAIDYPALAREVGLEGLVTVLFRIDAQGKVQQAWIEKRVLSVPLIRGQRPVAFETLLDAASLARVRAGPHEPPKEVTLKHGLAVRRIEYDWKLQ